MTKLNVYITEKQKDALQKRAKETGLKLAEVLRRAIDDSLDNHKGENP